MNAQLTSALLERWVLPTAGKIQEIATREGIDAATTQLYQSVLESPQHGPFVRRIDEICKRVEPQRWQAEAPLVIVPGAFYRENPRSAQTAACCANKLSDSIARRDHPHRQPGNIETERAHHL